MDKRIVFLKSHKLTKKSQASFEFLILTGIALLILISVVVFAINQSNEIYREKEQNAVIDLLEEINNEINIATYANEGYYRNFTILNKIEKWDYEIFQTNNYITIKTKNYDHEIRLNTFNGTIKKGINTIRKQEGKIIIN